MTSYNIIWTINLQSNAKQALGISSVPSRQRLASSLELPKFSYKLVSDWGFAYELTRVVAFNCISTLLAEANTAR